MNTTELQQNYFKATGKEPVDKDGNFTSDYVEWLQDAITNRDCSDKYVNTTFSLFSLWKREWSKWEHVMYVEDFRAGIKNFEILRRECNLTGLTQYKSVYVKDCVHGLTAKLSQYIADKTKAKQ